MKQISRLFFALGVALASLSASAVPGNNSDQIEPNNASQESQQQKPSEQQKTFAELQRQAQQVVFETQDPQAIYEARKQLAEFIITNPTLFSSNNPNGISARNGHYSNSSRRTLALSSEEIREKIHEHSDMIAARIATRRKAREERLSAQRRKIEERRSVANLYY